MLPVVGTLPTTEANLYTVPTARKAKLTWMAVNNPTSGASTFTMYLTVNSTKVALTPTLRLNASEFGEQGLELWLLAGAKVSGVAAASGLTYILSGEEYAL